MHISIADLELTLAWLKANSADTAVRIALDGAQLQIWAGDTVAGGVALIRLFEAEAGQQLQPKISTEDYLKHKVKKL